jgi:hypothetical protein
VRPTKQTLLPAFDAPFCLGPDVVAAVRFATHTGPTGRVLAMTDDAQRAAVRERVGLHLEHHLAAGRRSPLGRTIWLDGG